MPEAIRTESTMTKEKFYQKWWFWAFIIMILVISVTIYSDRTKRADKSNSQSTTATQPTTFTPPVETKAPKPSNPAENKSALIKANSYASTQNMSKQRLYDQLISQYG